MVGDLKGKTVLILIALALSCMPTLGQTTAIDWDNKGIELVAYGKYEDAIQAYDNAINIDPHDKIAWKNKADALKALGRTAAADEAYSKVKELEIGETATVLDHFMASKIDEPTNNVISRTHEFSVNDSKAYSWLSLSNVGASSIWWYWYSPTGKMLHMDKAEIPSPKGADRWSIYNTSSHINISGGDAANLPGDWHIDVNLNGDKILTEYFSISKGQKTTTPDIRQFYNSSKYDEISRTLENNDKYEKVMNKADNLNNQGRYDEAISAYEEAININPNDFQNWMAWNGKGEALYKQGKYNEAIQAYDNAIEIIPDNSIVWANKGAALKALGRTNESDVAYATANELGDNSAWIPKTNATGINLTSLYYIQILDHTMASNVDENTNKVTTRTDTFSGTDSKVYSWLSLGHVLGAKVDWHWYSPDGNPYKTDSLDVPRQESGGYWPSYNVWDFLDVAKMPNESYLSGNWHVDIYINSQKRQTEQFTMKIGSGTATPNPNVAPGTSGPSSEHGTIKVLDHCLASKIDEPTKVPVTTTKTSEFKDNMEANSWLSLGNIGAARVEWDWHNGAGWDIKDTYNIPPNPKGGYYSSYNVWSPLYISSLASSYRQGESDAEQSCESAELYAERQGWASASCHTNNVADPYGDWTVDVYLNDQWLLQEQFRVVSG